MSILNFWNKKKENSSAMIATLPVTNQSTSAAEEVETDQATPDAPTEKKTLTVSYATGWPIDVIYGYLHKNYEEKGFNDAMVNIDIAFKDINMGLIRNKILIVFQEINLNYDVMKRDIETRIETCSAAGLLTTLTELEKQMAIIATHKEELERLESDFRNNANEASIPLQSYNCGFLRGIATISMATPSRSAVMPQSSVVSPISQQKATA